ncbi:MAG: hypothetical protein H7Y18_11865 [Clostridiaceae bacterium]|nr:hypothetical protein [Clostridiaceae bacterium]
MSSKSNTGATNINETPRINAEAVKLLVATLKDEHINLYSIGYNIEDASGLRQFHLDINGKIRIFNWFNAWNPLYYPKLLYKDINKDGEKELVIFSKFNDAKDELKQELHIINVNDLTEVQSKLSMDNILANEENKGLENRFLAVINKTKTKLLSSVKEFNADNGRFQPLKVKALADYARALLRFFTFYLLSSHKHLYVIISIRYSTNTEVIYQYLDNIWR